MLNLYAILQCYLYAILILARYPYTLDVVIQIHRNPSLLRDKDISSESSVTIFANCCIYCKNETEPGFGAVTSTIAVKYFQRVSLRTRIFPYFLQLM